MRKQLLKKPNKANWDMIWGKQHYLRKFPAFQRILLSGTNLENQIATSSYAKGKCQDYR